MEDITNNPPPTYHIPTSRPLNLISPADIVSSSSDFEIWEFELRSIEYVDNERVAVYKYKGKR